MEMIPLVTSYQQRLEAKMESQNRFAFFILLVFQVTFFYYEDLSISWSTNLVGFGVPDQFHFLLLSSWSLWCDASCRPLVIWQNVLWGLGPLELFSRCIIVARVFVMVAVLVLLSLSWLVHMFLPSGKMLGNWRNSSYKEGFARQKI